jgi:hypothetical protein
VYALFLWEVKEEKGLARLLYTLVQQLGFIYLATSIL